MDYRYSVVFVCGGCVGVYVCMFVCAWMDLFSNVSERSYPVVYK